MRYQKTQLGTTTLIISAAVLILILALQGRSPYHLGSIAALVIIVACMIVFSSMTVRVTDTEVEWWLTLPLLRGHVPLDNIKSAAAAVASPIHSLGIRTNGRDWTWILSGRNLVEIILKDDKRIRLGTDDAPRLLKAINSQIA